MRFAMDDCVEVVKETSIHCGFEEQAMFGDLPKDAAILCWFADSYSMFAPSPLGLRPSPTLHPLHMMKMTLVIRRAIRLRIHANHSILPFLASQDIRVALERV